MTHSLNTSGANATHAAIGAVVIGRNEGERLKRCLASVVQIRSQLVYVDSGSSDGSAQWTREQGIDVVELNLDKPFTAARARNEGLRRLCEIAPSLEFVQFVDGDCEIAPDWMNAAGDFLVTHPCVAAVSGRLRERFPEKSIYNLLCDMEWDAPIGESAATGGNTMIRRAALNAAGGYRDDLIAGEEPELCVRLRGSGWKVWRLANDMGWHDAAMTRFGQWWSRAMRGGYAYAQGAWMHGQPPEHHGKVATCRAMLWGAALPAAILGLTVVNPIWAVLALAYPLQILRLAMRDGISLPERRWRALFLILARFPEAQGVMKFWLDLIRQRRSALIEYK